MSGIAGLWRLDGRRADGAELDRMLEPLARRGPDGSGGWLDGAVGLGHRMLHVTPESLHEKLPVVDQAGELALTADVRLDNREELLEALHVPERVGEPVGDAELLLRAWRTWGEACPAHLLGDFAFAVWDGRCGMLFCARDPTGVKPFYYHHGPRLFAFASEVKALLALPDIPRRIDELQVGRYLMPGRADRTATFYASVRRLPAGHRLSVTLDGAAPTAYWALDPTREAPAASDTEHADAFRTVFTDAVRRRLRSVFPVGAALSGGLDSSSVVVVARSLASGPLATYSAVFPTVPECDERAYIEAVVAGGGLEPHAVRGDALDPLADLEEAPRHAHETFHPPGYYMHDALYTAARADGVRAFLEGTGGDLVVSHGIGHLHDLARHGRWLALLGIARQLARAHGQPTARVLRAVAGAIAPEAARRVWRAARRRRPSGESLVRADLARRVDAERRALAAAVEEAPRPGGAPLDGARRHQWEHLVSHGFADVVEGLEAAAADAALELRDPFLDRRVVELCLALPVAQKIRGGTTRVVLRHAIGPLLPREVRERLGKAPLDRMLAGALAAYGRERLTARMRDAREVLAPFVNVDALDRVYQRYLQHGARRDLHAVWRLASLAIWVRRVAGSP